MSEKKIIVSNLSKDYKMYAKPTDRLREVFSPARQPLHTTFHALSDVSFSVKKGEILGIMGKNGAGKSTLLKILTGVLTPTSGNSQIKGRISSLLELGTGFNTEYTGIENIYFYGTLMGLTNEQINDRLEEIISFAEIGDHVYQPVKTYSSGMFARLAFSCAINVDPEILIVDEILSVGDIRFQAKSFSRFQDFKDKGVTIIYVGHDISTMRTFCDVCMWLDNGKVIEIGDPTYVSSRYSEFMYGNKEQVLPESRTTKAATKESSDNSKPTEKELMEPEVDEQNSRNKPLTHWGSHCGMIKNIIVKDVKGKDIDLILPNERIVISFDIESPRDFDSKHLSAAISIKDKNGIDLIVETTHDRQIVFKDQSSWHAEYTLDLPLNVGDYYIVLALENRENKIISYYEYIEGVKYFKIFSPNRELYGVFLLGDAAKIRVK